MECVAVRAQTTPQVPLKTVFLLVVVGFVPYNRKRTIQLLHKYDTYELMGEGHLGEG